LPIRLFFDICTYEDPSATSSTGKILYDGGVQLYLTDLVTVNVPLLISDDLDNYLNKTYGSKNAFSRRITFALNINNVNWLKLPSILLKQVVQ